jgi:hypothetical protein
LQELRRLNDEGVSKGGLNPPKKVDSNRTSQVHQSSIMKCKNNAQYIAKVLEGSTLNENKFEILRRWHKNELDFKIILGFKNNLWNSPHLDTDRNTISVREFERIKNEGEPIIRDGLAGAEPLVLKDCNMNDSFSLTKFSNLVDLFIYLPAKDLNRDSNRSSNMH